MAIKFEFFEAGCGDSILVSTDEGTNILIDGGVASTYKNKISYSLDKLYTTLDLVIVTHIDTDHICGIIELLNDKNRREKIDNFWFNTASEELTVMVNDSDEAGGGQGNLLSFFIKTRKIPHKNNIYVDTDLKNNIHYIGRDIKLTLLSPTKEGLVDLRKSWSENDKLKKCQGSSIEVAGVNPPKDEREINDLYKDYQNKKIKFGTKDTPTNTSSIAFILTYQDMEFLFLGDADINVINNSLKKILHSRSKKRLKVEFVKLSHHGSKKNINDEFLNLVQSDTFVILTNGTHPNNSTYKHPDKETLMLILKHQNRAKNVKFVFNHDLPRDKKFPFDMNEEIKYSFRADKKSCWSSKNEKK